MRRQFSFKDFSFISLGTPKIYSSVEMCFILHWEVVLHVMLLLGGGSHSKATACFLGDFPAKLQSLPHLLSRSIVLFFVFWVI